MSKKLNFGNYKLMTTECVLDTLLMENHYFMEELLSENDPSRRQEIICKYIVDIKKKNLKIGDFDQGLEWFNVSEPLSLLKQLRGKVVVLDFFTYCCINCMHIMPYLKELEKEFSVEDGVIVIGVHTPKFDYEKQPENLRTALRRYGITHPVANDTRMELWYRLGVICWPTLLVLGPSGEGLFLFLGEGNVHNLMLLIKGAVEYYRAEGELSNHQLPITIDAHYAPSLLRYPGNVTFCNTKNNTDASSSDTQNNSDSNDRLAVCDTGNHRIIIMTVTGKVEYLIGREEPGFIDGSLSEARFNSPQGVIFRNPDILYVADTGNHAIREINLKTQFVRTLAGTGVPKIDKEGGALWTEQALCSPWDLCLISSSQDDSEKDILIISMAAAHQIWALFLKNASFWQDEKYAEGTCVAICGRGREENRNSNDPEEAGFAQPSGLTIAPSLQELFVADSESSTIRRISLKNGKVSPVVGATKFPFELFKYGDIDGTLYDAKLQHPLGVAWCERNKTLYVADSYNHKLKAIDVSTNTCTTVFGTGNPGNAVGSFESPLDVQLNEPGGLCVNEAGDKLYIADTNNHCIKVVHLEKKCVEQLNIVFPQHQVDSKNPKSTEEVKTEVLINTTGGTLKLNLTLSLDDNITFTEDTTQKWDLVLPGDAWSSDTNTGEYTPETLLQISVPEANHDEVAKLFVNYHLYVCYQHSACSQQNLQIAVTVKYDKSAPKEVTHCISHVIAAKGLPSST